MKKLFVYLQPDFAVDEAKLKIVKKKFKHTIKIRYDEQKNISTIKKKEKKQTWF